MTTIAERLERAHDALTLIVAACDQLTDPTRDRTLIDVEDVVASVARTALSAREEIYWSKPAAAEVGSTRAPSIEKPTLARVGNG